MTGTTVARHEAGQFARAGSAASRDIVLIAALAAVAGIETVWSIAHVNGLIDIFIALGLHALIVATLGLVLLRGARGGATGPVRAIALLTTAITGPIGAACGLLLALLAGQRAEAPERLAQWYQRLARATAIDPAAGLAGQAEAGRVIDTAAALPASLTEVMAHGSIAERQRALGLMARTFRPDYLPALRVALASPEPVVRVQAAAVAARARAPLGRHVAELAARAGALPLATHDDLAAMLGLLDDLEFCLGSGLLEASEASSAGAVTRRLSDLVAGRAIATGFAGDDVQRTALERQLLVTGRFDAFRRLRAAARTRRVGRYRVRSISADRVRLRRALTRRAG